MRKTLFILICLLTIALPVTRSQEAAHEVITAENADSLTVIEKLGRGRVVDAGWTADGETLVVASATGLWLYDADDLDAEPRFLPSEDGQILSMAIHPEDLIVATGHENGVITLWDMDTMEPYSPTDNYYRSLMAHDKPVVALMFNRSGGWLISGGPSYPDPGIIRIWSWRSSVLERSITIDLMDVYEFTLDHVAISPDDRLIAAAGTSFNTHEDVRVVVVYSVENGAFLYPDAGKNVAFAPDNTLLVSGGAETMMGTGFPDFCFDDVDTSPDEQTLIFAEGGCYRTAIGHRLIFTDADVTRIIHEIELESEARSVAFHPEGHLFTAAHADGTVSIWDSASRKINKVISGFHGEVSDLVFRPGQESLLSASRDTGYYLWDVVSSEDIRSVYGKGFRDFKYSHDGSRIGYIGADDESCLLKIIWALDFQSLYSVPLTPFHTATRIIQDGEQAIPCGDVEMALHPDNRRAIVTVDHIVNQEESFFLDLASGEKTQTVNMSGTLSLQFTQGGDYLIYSDESVVIMLSTSSQKVAASFAAGIFTFSGQTHSEIAISDDNKWIAAAANNWSENGGQLYIWDTDADELIYSDFGGVSKYMYIYDIAFSPDGSLLAYGRPDGLIQIIAVPDGEIVAALEIPYGDATNLAFNSDGTILAAGYDSGVIFLWGVAPEGE